MMYLSYANLWKRLAAYGLKKTELMELTGMSSRTLSKLSKNETVNMETMMKICEVLHCRIEDVMTVSETFTSLSLYDAYCHTAQKEAENEHVMISRVSYLDKEYLIYETKKAANKLTIIDCAGYDVQWRQLPFNWRLSGLEMGDSVPIFREHPELRRGMTTLFVIAGKPAYFRGLDEGIFRSARHPGGEKFLHVMSMSAFKTFVG